MRSSSRPPLEQRVTVAILDGAAEALAHDADASMARVAQASGVAPATVDRYFPNREALLEALADEAVARVETALAAARLDDVPAPEGIRRVVGAFVDAGDAFVAVARHRELLAPSDFEARLAGPVRRLCDRAQRDGVIRGDLPSAALTDALVSLVVSVVGTCPGLGRDDTTALVTDLFLSGAGAPS